jgi:SAM-dependent methyltransferase
MPDTRSSARTALRAWRSFDDLSPATRAFLLARSSITPFGALDAELRQLKGRIVSLGSGHGMVERYLALVNPDVDVVGIELDGSRVDAAAGSAARFPRVDIRQGDVRDLGDLGTLDGAVAVDLFHHVPRDDHAAVVTALAQCLRPGSRVLVKEMDVDPAWKYQWNRWHDRVVNRTDVQCRAPHDLAALFQEAGFTCDSAAHVERALSPYPQYLLVLRR